MDKKSPRILYSLVEGMNLLKCPGSENLGQHVTSLLASPANLKTNDEWFHAKKLSEGASKYGAQAGSFASALSKKQDELAKEFKGASWKYNKIDGVK